MNTFARLVDPPNPAPPSVRLPLHLDLATDFAAADNDALTELAHRIVDPTLPVEWEVSLWQRRADVWECVPAVPTI